MEDFKDPRFKSVSVMLKANQISRFDDIFIYAPPTIVSRATKITAYRFSVCRKTPRRFELDEIYKLADLFDYDRTKMLNLVHKAANK